MLQVLDHALGRGVVVVAHHHVAKGIDQEYISQSVIP